MQIFKKPLLQARELISRCVSPGDIVMDATAGNGHDTLFLAQLVGDRGKVYSFDIQEEAIARTNQRLTDARLRHRVKLIHSGHEYLDLHVQEKLSAIMFNLGYLPGTDHQVITRPESSLSALQKGLAKLLSGGIITIVLYSGHDGGKEEKEILIDYCTGLPQDSYDVFFYEMINWVNHPPALLAIGKK